MARSCSLKIVVQPLVAFLIARYVVGLEPADVFAVTVIAALPTGAERVHRSRSATTRACVLARDSIFLSTVLAVPALVLIAALLA